MSASDRNRPEALQGGLSRRTVVKGMAWSVPVIAMSSAVPAYAVTGPPPVLTVGAACKQPGASCDSASKPYGFVKGYLFLVTVDNPDPDLPVYIYTELGFVGPCGELDPYFQVTSDVPFAYTSARLQDPLLTPPIGDPLGEPSQMIPAGGSISFYISAGTGTASPNEDASGSLYFPWGHTAEPCGDLDHPYTPAPGPLTSPPYGEGWIGAPFAFGSLPPCGTDCVPDGDETEILDPVPAL